MSALRNDLYWLYEIPTKTYLINVWIDIYPFYKYYEQYK
jgi:hypothetical protein